MRTVIVRAVVGLIAAVCAVYIGDYVVLTMRGWIKGQSSIVQTITVYDATPLKNGSDEVFYDQPEVQRCVDAIFAHLGYPPCWRVRRNPVRLIQ